MFDHGDLRATSDLMLEMVDRLRAAEEAKRGMAPGSPGFAPKAFEVLELARTVTRWAELQLRQANEAPRPGESAPSPALRDVPKRRLDEVLAEWRQAEIRLSQAHPDSGDRRTAADDADRLRDEYRELQARKMSEHRGEGAGPA